jgi:hypothetical protein
MNHLLKEQYVEAPDVSAFSWKNLAGSYRDLLTNMVAV